MHSEILSEEQRRITPLLKTLSPSFGLVGGTAIALHLGHRRSIDFDLFSQTDFDNVAMKALVEKHGPVTRELVNKEGEFTFVMDGVKITLFHYPFAIDFYEHFNGTINVADLLTLAAMKAYALGRRAKWKDYVDLYFIIKQQHPLHDIVEKTRQIFGSGFNEKLLRSQLSYFDDMDHSEKLIFMPGFEVDDNTIKKTLVELSLS
ncbi:MAG: nucleotidyl transferase AbiEii/AbiGii toxin family protein [Ilumatobacteraceae bacterium]